MTMAGLWNWLFYSEYSFSMWAVPLAFSVLNVALFVFSASFLREPGYPRRKFSMAATTLRGKIALFGSVYAWTTVPPLIFLFIIHSWMSFVAPNAVTIISILANLEAWLFVIISLPFYRNVRKSN